MDNIAQNTLIAHQWIAAFNEHDLEKLLSLYADDAIHFSPKLKLRKPDTEGWINGKAMLRNWWADAFERMPTLQYSLVNIIVNEEQLLMEYIRKVEFEPEMMVAEVLEIQNRLIIKSRVYHS